MSTVSSEISNINPSPKAKVLGRAPILLKGGKTLTEAKREAQAALNDARTNAVKARGALAEAKRDMQAADWKWKAAQKALKADPKNAALKQAVAEAKALAAAAARSASATEKAAKAALKAVTSAEAKKAGVLTRGAELKAKRRHLVASSGPLRSSR